MNYEILVKPQVVESFRKFQAGKSTSVVFKTTMEGYDDTLFICAHGNTDGHIVLGEYVFTSKELLQALINRYSLKDRGISKVYTVSCHGGLQDNAELEGISISSIHSSEDEIYTSCMLLWDGEEAAFNISTND